MPRVAVLAVIAASVVAAAACTHSTSPHPPTGPTATVGDNSPSASSSPIVISAPVAEVLTPTPDAHAALTAVQAWSRYSRKVGHPQTSVPTRLRVVLGRLTLPPQFSHRLVWAYAYGPIGCISTLPTSTPPTGIEWTFLDAGTGRMLEETCQRT